MLSSLPTRIIYIMSGLDGEIVRIKLDVVSATDKDHIYYVLFGWQNSEFFPE